MNAKTILLISGWPVYPPAAGAQVRSLGFARALARMGHRVTVFCVGGRRDDNRRARGEIREEIGEGVVQHIDLNLFRGVLQTLFRRIGAPRAWQYWLMRAGLAGAPLRRAVEGADLVFADLPHTPPLPGAAARKPWILVSHNVEWRLLLQGPIRERIWAGWMRGVESAAPKRYRDIIAVTDEDQAFFRELPGGRDLKLPIVSCCVDAHVYAPQPEQRGVVRARHGIADDEHVLIFTGSRWGPNAQAVKAIIRWADAQADWLLARRVRVMLVGSCVSQPFARGALVGVGRVPEIVPYLAAADAGLNPMASGSGANVKLFEYLAMHLPVIATTFGVRGTSLKPDEDYLLCGAEDMTDAVERFLQRDRAAWQAHAGAVWRAHRHYCDMDLAVREAMQVLGQA